MQTNPIANLAETVILPENGSIVIIDDQPEEAMPILSVLFKRGLAATYYRGNTEADLPATPVQSVRIVFLDLQLINTTDEHQIASGITNVLTRIISQDNGPYILVIWSKNFTKYGEEVIREIQNVPYLAPACIVNFDKRECLEEKTDLKFDRDNIAETILERLTGRFNEDDEEEIRSAIHNTLDEEVSTSFEAKANAMDIIENHIKTELLKAGVFHLFVMWENLTKKSASKMVAEVSGLVETNELWEVNMRNIFKRMGIARIGMNLVPMNTLIRESINTLNSSFIDSLENNLKTELIPATVNLDSPVIVASKIKDTHYSLNNESNQYSFFKNNNCLRKADNIKGLTTSVTKDENISEDDKDALKALLKKYDSFPTSLNTRLHIETSPSQELLPGNIYISTTTTDPVKSKYLKTFFKSALKGTLEDYFLIDLEVSPICDYAQNKWKRSRTLPGVLYRCNHGDEPKPGNNFYHVEPPFNIEGVLYKMIFDFHLFNAVDKENVRARLVKYRLKRELLLDIIAQLSSHVNRPGISFVQ